jgi:hypothetical protein
MTTVKHLFISLLVLFGYTSGAWAIEQDSEGYYLIGSVQDWKDFAAVVATTNDAKAKMIADIDLGDDQTTIGHPNESPSYHFKGVFDGQGYTLTVHYVKQGEKDICSPFPNISNATIKNIHITGTIESSTACQPAAIGCVRYGTSTIENVWSSVELTSTKSSWCEASGLVGCVDGYKNGHLVMTNCMVSGNIKSSGSYEGCFIGFINSGGSATVSNCLSVANFEYSGTSGFMGNYTNCYVKQFPSTIPSDMRVTDEQLADGTIATALGDGWVQDPLTNQPMLKIFATLKQDSEGYYLIGSVQDWKRFADIVKTTPNANARMIADVDLGDDQTMVGDAYYNNASMRVPFSGVFDGQGHTLTIHYVTENMPTSQRFFGGAPFGYVVNGTIRNLHTAGTLTSSHEGVSGMIGYADGNTLIENSRSSVNITFTASYGGAGFVYWSHSNSSILTLRDCIYDGTITGSQGYNSGLVVWYPNGECRIENSLVAATFNGSSYDCCTFIRPRNSNHTITNSYYKTAVGTVQGTQATAEELSDGTTATALQADREEEIWVQDPVLGIPMLKIFANEETEQPSEALNGVFTINASGEKVSFAKGNLQKIGSTYQFAEHQYDYFGTDQSDTHRDMYAFLDYSNPDNGESWSMLSWEEWKYLFATRSVTNTLSDGARYTMATLGGTYKGLIIFPDYYTHPEGTDFTPGVFDSNSNYTAKVSLEGWAMMEAAGCVFLPAAGWCSAGIDWYGVGEEVGYMSSTPTGSKYYSPYFTPEGVYLDEISRQITWTSIRLVMRLQPLTYTVPASGVGTFSSEVNIHLPEGLNAHYCKTYYAERSAISVEDISSGVVPANTGVLLSGTPGETFNLYRTHETADELEGNALVAVTEPTHINATEGDYTNFMMKGGKFIRIADESEDVKMPANRAYLPLLTADISGSNAKEIMLLWDDKEATGIESLTPGPSPMGEESIYNLNGQKLSSPLKGINIINGRKVIVK